jgi:hypothetical protein
LGFIKTYRERFPCLQRQLDIALHVFVDEKKERGVALMLWLGADPYAMTPCTADPDDASISSNSAMESALWAPMEFRWRRRTLPPSCGSPSHPPRPSVRPGPCGPHVAC